MGQATFDGKPITRESLKLFFMSSHSVPESYENQLYKGIQKIDQTVINSKLVSFNTMTVEFFSIIRDTSKIVDVRNHKFEESLFERNGDDLFIFSETHNILWDEAYFINLIPKLSKKGYSVIVLEGLQKEDQSEYDELLLHTKNIKDLEKKYALISNDILIDTLDSGNPERDKYFRKIIITALMNNIKIRCPEEINKDEKIKNDPDYIVNGRNKIYTDLIKKDVSQNEKVILHIGSTHLIGILSLCKEYNMQSTALTCYSASDNINEFRFGIDKNNENSYYLLGFTEYPK